MKPTSVRQSPPLPAHTLLPTDLVSGDYLSGRRFWMLLSALLGGLSATFLSLTASRLGVALGEGGTIPSAHALMTRKIKPERRGLGIGIFSMGIPLGTMVGFAAGGAIGDTLGWRIAFFGGGAIGGLLALLTMFVAGSTPSLDRTEAERPPFWQSSLQLLSSPAFRWLFIGAIAVGFAATPFYAFAAPFLIRNYGFTASEVRLTFGLLVAGPGKQAMASSLVLTGSGLLGPALGPVIVGAVSDAATAAQVPNGLGLGLLIVPFASAVTGFAMLVANRRIAALLRSH